MEFNQRHLRLHNHFFAIATLLLLVAPASAQSLGDKTTQFPYFNARVGSAAMNIEYKFTGEPGLVEMARLQSRMGSDVIKFQFAGARYRELYSDLPELPPEKRSSIVQLLESEPAFRTVLDMPFKFFLMYTYAMDMDGYGAIQKGYAESPAARSEYKQIYDLTRYLLTHYENSGKVFMIGNWETDWPLLEGQGDQGVPRADRIQGFIEWFNNRYRAVDDARKSLPEVKNVEVIYYEEVNVIQKLIDDPQQLGVTNAVLPHVTVDAVSYSAYNAINHVDELPGRLNRHLDFIESHAKLSGKWRYGKPVFIGEYNYAHRPNSQERTAMGRQALRAAGAWGCPLIIFWMTYSGVFTTPWDTPAYVDPDGTYTREYFDQQEYLGKLHTLKNATRVWLNRNPTEDEINKLSEHFDETSNAKILVQVIDSEEFRQSISDEEFVGRQLTLMLDDGETAESLGSEVLNQLASREITRSQAIFRLLDSKEFATNVPEADFLKSLTRNQRYVPASESANCSRSKLWQAAVDGKPFWMQELMWRDKQSVDDAVFRKFMPFIHVQADGRAVAASSVAP